MEHVEIIISTDDNTCALCEIRSIEGEVLGRVENVPLDRGGYLWTLRDGAGRWLAEGKVGPHDARAPQARARAIWRAFEPKP